jgi:hypothetical protein
MTISQPQAAAISLTPEEARQRLVDDYGFVPRADWGRLHDVLVRDPAITAAESMTTVSDKHKGLDLDKPVYELTFTEADGRKSAIAVQELQLIGLLAIAAPNHDVRTVKFSASRMFSIHKILTEAVAAPLHGHGGSWCPITVSGSEQSTLQDLSANDERQDDETLRQATRELLGTERFEAIAEFAWVEDREASRGYVCRCGCGCKNQHYHPASDYCNACRNGCCGE